jgi:RNA polymerase sigma-54 factor
LQRRLITAFAALLNEVIMLQSQWQQTSTHTSAHLAQTMTLLSLTAAELQQKIDSELAENPALELVEERRCPMCKRLLPPGGPCPICSQPKSDASDEPIVFISPREDFYTGISTGSHEIPDEPFASESIDLPAYVLKQAASKLRTEDRMLAAYILSNLDEDGLLTTTLMEIARYHHRLPSEIEDVIALLKHCDPVGVCSANPGEAMLAQIDSLEEVTDVPELTREIVQHHLHQVSQHHFSEIARELSTTAHQVQLVANFISENLNPFPARAYWGDVRNPGTSGTEVFHQPDVLVYYLNDKPGNPLVVEIILPVRGTLKVNQLFKESMKSVDQEQAEVWKGDIEKASLLIKCIQQRSNAMKLLLEKLVVIQKDYIVGGDKNMVPLTRAQIAQELGLHESTISRAVSGKTLQLPNKKIVPMAIFFDRSLSLRTIIKEMIEQEDHPMSDSEIKERLEEDGVTIARRTVAKYRSMEGILPAHLRQKNPGSMG